MIHDVGTSPEGSHRQTPADYLSEGAEVGGYARQFLDSSPSEAEAGHHFVEDEQGSMFVG